jgi:hypothetical protein
VACFAQDQSYLLVVFQTEVSKIFDAVFLLISVLARSLNVDQLLQLHQFDIELFFVVLVLSCDDLIEIKEFLVLKDANHGIFVVLVVERLLRIMHQEKTKVPAEIKTSVAGLKTKAVCICTALQGVDACPITMQS